MVRDIKKYILVTTLLIGIICSVAPLISNAGEPEFFFKQHPKQMVLDLGFGYGVSNNPCTGCDDSDKLIGGPVFHLSLGYQINPRFKVDFGPTLWVEGKDVYQKNNSADRPANKRMIISFNGYYFPIKNNPLNFKLGAGVGNLLYTPENNKVVPDSKTYDNSEFLSGFAGTFSVAYSLKICPALKIHPSFNLWYTDLSNNKSTYKSYIDDKKHSVTSDFRASFLFNF
ncbi:MAG TPA: hypothetical protein PKD91_05910 [Bacteroidia bacterium]|nr:hypothetical protein [Bacteroidia bacterium]